MSSPGNTHKLRLKYELAGHTERVWCCTWNTQKTILATAGGDKIIKLWTYSSLDNEFKCIETLEGHTRAVRSISWHPLGNLFCSASFDGTIGVWQCSNHKWECVDLLEGHDNEVKCVSWDSTGTLLASCSRDKSVWIWEYDCNDTEFEVIAVKRSHSADVKCVRWHPSQPFLVSASYDNTVKTYKYDKDEDDWYINQVLKKHNSTVWSLAFDPLKGDEFVSCSDDQSLIIWDKIPINGNEKSEDSLINLDEFAFKLKQSLTDNIHSEPIYAIDWLSDAQFGVNIIASCSGDNCVNLYTQKNNLWQILIQQNNAHSNDVNWIEFGPRIKEGVYLIATASDDRLIKIWQLEIVFDDSYNDIVNEVD